MEDHNLGERYLLGASLGVFSSLVAADAGLEERLRKVNMQ